MGIDIEKKILCDWICGRRREKDAFGSEKHGKRRTEEQKDFVNVIF